MVKSYVTFSVSSRFLLKEYVLLKNEIVSMSDKSSSKSSWARAPLYIGSGPKEYVKTKINGIHKTGKIVVIFLAFFGFLAPSAQACASIS